MTFGHFNATERTSIQEHPGASMLGRLLRTLIKQRVHVEQARSVLLCTLSHPAQLQAVMFFYSLWVTHLFSASNL